MTRLTFIIVDINFIIQPIKILFIMYSIFNINLKIIITILIIKQKHCPIKMYKINDNMVKANLPFHCPWSIIFYLVWQVQDQIFIFIGAYKIFKLFG